MMSADGQSSHRRYDCFLSFYGDEWLADLGFSECDMNSTVRNLAERARQFLMSFENRQPSVFYHDSEIGGSIVGDIAQAILLLRGGGVGLVLLSRKFLGRSLCLAEFRAFLELEKLKNSERGSGEAIEVRVVCLEKEKRPILSELEHPDLKKFFEELNPRWFKLHSVDHGGAFDAVVSDICKPVENYWRDNSSLCLGNDRPICLSYLQEFFPPNSLSLVSNALRVQPAHGQTLDSVFRQALLQNKLTHSNLEALSQAAVKFSAKDVVCSFRRKWISLSWRYGTGPGKVSFPFHSFVKHADKAAKSKPGTSSYTAADPTTTPTPFQPPESRPHGPHSHDTFRPYIPDGQRLGDGLEANAATNLAQLKAAILSADYANGSSIGSDSGNRELGVGLRCVALTSVAGEGGVGKTSTCKLLFADEKVRKHFAGGALLWIDVGRGATEEKVKGQVRSAMRDCGGMDLAREISSDVDIDEAVGIARAFFSRHRILVVIDNVWETAVDSSLVSWAEKLAAIASCLGSAVIMTTRSSSLSESSGFTPIRLGRLDLAANSSPDWRIAEQVYDAQLGATPEEQSSTDYKKHRRKGLGLSCGSLLAIGTFAGLVRNRMLNGGSVETLLENIDKRVLCLAAKSVGNEMKDRMRHYGLFAAMEESLAHLDEQRSDCVKLTRLKELRDGEGKDVRFFRASYDSHSDKKLSSRYAALEVMPESSTRLSLPILCHLWHVATVTEAEEIAVAFVGIGLGSFEGGSPAHEGQLVLHDLQYEFCVNFSKVRRTATAGSSSGNSEALSRHAIFLSSCESLVGPFGAADGPGFEWASFCFQEE